MDELDRIKRLAGINEFKGYMKYEAVDPYGGSNVSITGTEKRQLERALDIKPGTQEWFKLWFSLPYLTGEKPVTETVTKEASYPGNIGAMEVMKFYKIANPEEKAAFKHLLSKKNLKNAWALIQKVTGVKLQGKEFAA
jgi:hypothetical protein